MLGRTGTHLAGAVLNKVDIERDHYYYTGYYSYTRYGYYGDAPPDTSSHKTCRLRLESRMIANFRFLEAGILAFECGAAFVVCSVSPALIVCHDEE